MRRFIFCVALFCASQSSVNSQVGIGTTTPDPSSILDITSTTKGVLSPRMTTSQRTAIVGPVKGLLVFDTSLNVFYFYNGSVWLPLEGSEKRNNYRLIKSAADLSAELTAGGNSKYLLNTNTLYEINGTINLAVPIDLNDAYLLGADTNEDVLVRAGGTIFSGSKGGSIKNLTLVAPGGTVFSLAGTGVENLIFRDCIVANSGTVGSISSFNLVFNSIVQFVNNTNGITYSNINQLLLNNQGWNSTNGGTYEKFVGTFNILAKQGGFSQVTTATAAIDITGITSITGDAGLRIVDFFGGGNYINGVADYIGYKFTKDWDVDSPGLKVETNQVAIGNVYIITPAVTTITSANVPVKIAGTTTSLNLFRTDTNSVNNRIRYVGKTNRNFSYSVSFSVTAATNNKTFNFYIYKNGVKLPESKQSRKIGTGGDVGSASLTGLVNLATNDYIEVWVENETDGTNITAQSLNFVLR